MYKVLVTGGAGFIGSNLSNKLLELGFDVAAVDNLSTGSAGNLLKEVKLYNIDITDRRLYEIFKKEKPDYVMHEAAQADVHRSMREPGFDADTNISGTINVLECCRMTGVKKLLHASSAAVFGHPDYLGIDESHRQNPISFYGLSKKISEEYIRFYGKVFGLNYTILRYSNVYGDRQSTRGESGVISIFIQNMLRGKKSIIYGSGEQSRDFIYMADVVKANIYALERGDNEDFNIGTGIGTSINGLFAALSNIIEASGYQYEEAQKGDIQHSYFNTEKSSRILGWKAECKLAEGLKRTVDYYRDKL